MENKYYCSGCGAEKTRQGGKKRRLVCRPCDKPKKAAWRKANKGRLQQFDRDRHKENPDIRRGQALRKMYGITLGEYNEMLSIQGGVCKVCKQSEINKSKRFKNLAVDHCHKTGLIRGLLCSPCNRALGLMYEDAESIERLAEYIKSFKHLALVG